MHLWPIYLLLPVAYAWIFFGFWCACLQTFELVHLCSHKFLRLGTENVRALCKQSGKQKGWWMSELKEEARNCTSCTSRSTKVSRENRNSENDGMKRMCCAHSVQPFAYDLKFDQIHGVQMYANSKVRTKDAHIYTHKWTMGTHTLAELCTHRCHPI